MKKRIYILRHGQTDLNKLKILQGRRTDSSLNAEGIRQSEVFYETHKHIPFQKIYTSTQKRSFESIISFINDLNIPHQKMSGLDELDWGKKDGQDYGEGDNYHGKMSDLWSTGKTDVRVIDGESPQDVQNRQMEDWKTIEASEDNLILVSMHGRALRILLCALMKKPLHEMNHFPHTNLAYYVLEHDNSDQRYPYKILEFCNSEYFKAYNIKPWI